MNRTPRALLDQASAAAAIPCVQNPAGRVYKRSGVQLGSSGCTRPPDFVEQSYYCLQ